MADLTKAFTVAPPEKFELEIRRGRAGGNALYLNGQKLPILADPNWKLEQRSGGLTVLTCALAVEIKTLDDG